MELLREYVERSKAVNLEIVNYIKSLFQKSPRAVKNNPEASKVHIDLWLDNAYGKLLDYQKELSEFEFYQLKSWPFWDMRGILIRSKEKFYSNGKKNPWRDIREVKRRLKKKALLLAEILKWPHIATCG